MNKPAFPRGNSQATPQEGMSLLEYYAGQALIGFLTASGEALLNPDKAAGWAFEQAEAMVAESKKWQ